LDRADWQSNRRPAQLANCGGGHGEEEVNTRRSEMVVADKYRGKKEYHLAYQELITAARYRGTVTYQEIAQIMGLPLSGQYMAQQVGQMLGEISEDEHLQGRPMLSAVAVGVSDLPGEGFFGLARKLGKLNDDSAEGKRRFWEKERAAAYGVWRKDIQGK